MCKHILTFPAVFFAVLIVFAKNKKARDGIRTRGPRLGKAMLHH